MATVKNEQLLVETRDFKDLNVPLARTSRLRYTSLSISEKLVGLGSNTGGIYIFSKADCKLLQIAFADKETAAVTLLLISPNEKFVAFSVSTGKIHVIDLKLDTRSKSETLRSVTDTGGAIVTCLKWDDTSSKLFIGDDMGKVTMVPVHTSKAKSLFSLPMEVIMKLDSAVVQIDKAEEKLLVSTVTCCYLCNTSRQQYTQIGKKPRDGKFGACFLSQDSTGSMIYCARPGSRIWEVDMEGAVLNTHQFKQLLAVGPLSILDINRNFTLPDESESYPGQSVVFPKLKIISGRFLLSWNSSAIFVLDPVNVRLILWTNHFNGILDVHCVRDELYVFLSTMQVHCLKLMPVSKAIHTCMDESRVEVVARLCCYYGNILHRKHLRKHLGIQDMYKIYNALEVNEMHDLSEEVLGCIKEIEQKVAMETDTDTSSSSRSRSSSIQSVSSEISTVVTDALNMQNKMETSKVVGTKSEVTNGGAKNLNVDTDLTVDGLDVEPSSVITDSFIHNEKRETLNVGSKTVVKDKTISEQNLLNVTKETNVEESAIIFRSLNRIEAEDNRFVNTISFKSDHGQNMLNVEDVELERGEPEGQSYTTDYIEGKGAFGEHVNKSDSNEHLDQTRTYVRVAEENLIIPKEDEKQNEHNDSQFSSKYQHSENEISYTSSVDIPQTLKSQDPSSVNENLADGIDYEDDTFDESLTDKINFGPRRPSLTSLSSYSSAEVTMDLPFPESEEQIAVQVKRRVSVRKKKKKRKSSTDVFSSSNQGLSKSLSEDTPGPTDSVIADGDNISEYGNDDTDGGVADTLDGTATMGIAGDSVFSDIKETATDCNAAVDTSKLEIPKIVTNTPTDDYSGSGEFHHSSDWGMSGEFTTSGSTFLQSFEQSTEEKLSVSPTSAGKLAFRKFKDKMQNQVTSKTKKLIQNIKDKNIISKAKELAETLSQGPDLSLVSGGYLDPQQFEIYTDQTSITGGFPETEAKEKDHLNEIARGVTPVVDITDLQKSTDKVKTELEDPRIFTDIDNVNKLLVEWIVVLNQTFHRFHVKKFAPSVQQNATLKYNETFTSHSIVNNEAIKQSEAELDKHSNNNAENGPTVSNEENQDQKTFEKDVYPSDVDLKLTSDNFEKILSDPDIFYLSDPLKLPSELLVDVSKFAHACFEIGCHGNILAYRKLQNEIFLDKDNKESEQICDIDETDIQINNDSYLCNSVKNETSGIKNALKEQDDYNKSSILTNCLQEDIEPDIKCDTRDQDKNTYGSQSSGVGTVKTAEVSDNTTADTKTELILHPNCDITDYSPMNFFIRLYFPYLEIHKIKKECLHYSEWAALVTCLQGCAIDEGDRLGIKEDSMISHILESRHKKNGGMILLGHISRLFFTKDSSIIDASVQCFPHIQPIDVLYLSRYHGVTIETIFKQYMHKLLEHLKKIHKPDVEECLFGNSEVRLVWLEVLLVEEPETDKLMDGQRNPRVMSHKVARMNSHLLEQVLSKFGYYHSTDIKDLLTLFYKYGYWKGVLLALKYLKDTEEHSRIILCLGDAELLSDTHPQGYLPSTMEEWKNLLTSFKEIRKAGTQELDTEISDWSISITWNSLAVLLVETVGPHLALDLLKTFDVEDGALNPDFYKRCLLSSMVQKQKRSILHSMLEKIDMYLWSQRPAVVTPQVHYLLLNEERIKGVSSEKGASHGEETIQSMTARLKGDKSLQHLPLAEDPDCHWGVKTKFNMLCGCCNIPLKEIVSHSQPGVLLFRCGKCLRKCVLPVTT